MNLSVWNSLWLAVLEPRDDFGLRLTGTFESTKNHCRWLFAWYSTAKLMNVGVMMTALYESTHLNKVDWRAHRVVVS